MHKCRLCQQIFNNLTNIYSNRLKSLAKTILKLKGFKDSWDVNNNLALCENCIKGVENVALFWENIPEAKTETADILGKLEEANTNSIFRVEHNLPAIQLVSQEQNQYEATTSVSQILEPIKLRIKLPHKRKKKDLLNSINTPINMEPLQKRTRRCPKRYEDFQLTTSHKTAASIRADSASVDCSEVSFNNLPHIALLRLENGSNIGTLAEIESKRTSCNIRILCQICCQIFNFEKLFQAHLKTHFAHDPQCEDISKKYLFHCKLCDKCFPGHRAVRQHYKFAHSEHRIFKCLHCEANFKYKFNLMYHISTKHESKKPFECTFCKKMFCMRYELEIHVRTHTKERPYKCEFCAFACAHKSNLKTHQRAKHSNSSTNTTALTGFVESEHCKISSRQFVPPEIHLEKENEFMSNFNDDSKFKDAVNIENSVVAKKQFYKHHELQMIQEQALQCDANQDSVNIDYFSSERLSPPKIFLPPNNEVQEELSTRHICESSILTTFENITKNLEENIEHDETKKTLRTENYSQTTNVEAECTFTNAGNNNILKVTSINENSEGFLKCQPTLGVFQLDSRILKVLPSTSLLGLKKWPKTFQSTPNNQLQLIKTDSTRFNFEELNKFEINNTIQESNIYQKSQIVMENIEHPASDYSHSIMKYKPLGNSNSCVAVSSENAHNATILNQTRSIAGLNSPQINVKVSDSRGNKLIKFTKPTETFTMKMEQKPLNDKLKTYEINLNRTSIKDLHEKQNLESWKEIKLSSRPIKIKNILNSNQTSDEINSRITNHVLPKGISINMNKNPTEYLNSNNSLKSIASESLLKPVVKTPQTTSLTFKDSVTNQHIVLANKPVVTKIEIIPPFQMINTTLQNPSTITNIIKPPSDYKFQCHYCYKYFKQKSPLTKHLRTHTGEKPYKCNLCPKSYADASNYKKHKVLHKNAAEALSISRTYTTTTATTYAVQSSPAYSTVSDPDPDGIEVMQTLQKFESSSTETDEYDDDEDDVDKNASISSSSNMDSQMWHDALDQALLINDDLRENLRRNLMGCNNVILPKSMQQITNAIDLKQAFSTEDPE